MCVDGFLTGSFGLTSPPWVLHLTVPTWILSLLYLEYGEVAKGCLRPSTFFLDLLSPPFILSSTSTFLSVMVLSLFMYLYMHLFLLFLYPSHVTWIGLGRLSPSLRIWTLGWGYRVTRFLRQLLACSYPSLPSFLLAASTLVSVHTTDLLPLLIMLTCFSVHLRHFLSFLGLAPILCTDWSSPYLHYRAPSVPFPVWYE